MRKNAKWWVLGALVLVNFVVWYAVAQQRSHVLTVSFLDVGQGDAIFIESPSGKQVLVDGGPGRAVLRELGTVMPFYDRTIDVIIATHPDADHVTGLSDVLESYQVGLIFESGAQSDTGMYKEFHELSESEDGAKHITARRGQVIDFGDGAFVRILFPDRDVSSVESNSASIITQIVYGDTEVLLTGDAPKNIEQYVAQLEGAQLESDILKPGHHGSKTASSETFVGWVDPVYAVFSRGCDNRYGHPHEEVVDLLNRFEIETLDTCESGTISFVSDGKTISLK